jgi:G:T-mismatch repair DNA endonuclease (very short patch repair protein)
MRLFYSRINGRQNPDVVIISYNSVSYRNVYFAHGCNWTRLTHWSTFYTRLGLL